MSLTPNNVLNNPVLAPTAPVYAMPDSLRAGGPVTASVPIIVASGAGVLRRGTVMGLVTATGKYIASLPTAVDGSQTPLLILADIVDATSADANAAGLLSGEFNANSLTFGTWGLAALTAAMRPYDIVIKTVSAALSNADAT